MPVISEQVLDSTSAELGRAWPSQTFDWLNSQVWVDTFRLTLDLLLKSNGWGQNQKTLLDQLTTSQVNHGLERAPDHPQIHTRRSLRNLLFCF